MATEPAVGQRESSRALAIELGAKRALDSGLVTAVNCRLGHCAVCTSQLASGRADCDQARGPLRLGVADAAA
jgi:hypothetical protein